MIVIGGYRHPELGFKVIDDMDSDQAGEWLENAYFDLTCRSWEDWGTDHTGKRIVVATRLLTPIITFDQNLERMFDMIIGHDRRWFNRRPSSVLQSTPRKGE